jgi:hypothetical protein
MPSYDAAMIETKRCRSISGRISNVMKRHESDIELWRPPKILCMNADLESIAMIHKKTLIAAGLIGATLGLQGLALASAPPPPVHRLDWTLSQTPPMHWTQGQPVSVLVGLGLSDPHRLWIQDSPPPVAPLAPAAVTGWTKPIGLRLAVRW